MGLDWVGQRPDRDVWRGGAPTTEPPGGPQQGAKPPRGQVDRIQEQEAAGGAERPQEAPKPARRPKAKRQAARGRQGRSQARSEAQEPIVGAAGGAVSAQEATEAPKAAKGEGEGKGKPKKRRKAAQEPQDQPQIAVGDLKTGTTPPPSRFPALQKQNWEEAYRTCARWAVGLLTTEELLAELDAPELTVRNFLAYHAHAKAVRRMVFDLRESGEAANRLAATELTHGVQAMGKIVRDENAGHGAKIGATNTLAKVAGSVGPGKKETDGQRFSVTINLGGDTQTITTDVIEGQAERV